MVLALAGLVVAEYSTHQILIVNLATIGAFFIALWFSLPRRNVLQGELDSAAQKLRLQARKNWQERRFVLLGESESATVTYVRQQGLESGATNCDWGEGDVRNIYQKYSDIRSGRLMILGPPGSGKTLAAINLVTEILLLGLSAPDERMVPIPVSIGGWDGTQRLGDWLGDRLVEGYRIARPVAMKLVYGDYILPVLDGLDEAGSGLDDDDSAASHRILEQIRSSPEASDIAHGALVMTCRTDFYAELFESGHSLRNAVVVEMKDLEPEAIRSYLHTRFSDDPRHDPYRSDSFLAAIEQDGSCLVRALAKPLILTLAISVLKAEYSNPRQLARYTKVSSLRKHLIRRLIRSTVRANPRDPLPRIIGGTRKVALPWRRSKASYDADDVQRWLLNIATYRHRGRLLPAEVYPDQLWSLAGSKSVRAIHTTLSLVFGLMLAGLAAELVAGATGYVVTALTGVTAVCFALWAGLVRRPQPRHLSFKQFATPVGLLRLLAIVVLGVVCAIGGYLDGGWKTAVTSGIGGTIAFTVVVGLIGGIPETIDPRLILRNDLLFGSLFGLGVSIAAALPGGLTGGIAVGLHLNRDLGVLGSACLAVAIAIPAGIALGSRCWTRYAIMLVLLAPRRQVPWRTMHFIRWCYIANLLRVSGVGYEFRHQEILEALESHMSGRGA